VSLLGTGRRVTALTHDLAGRPEFTLDVLGRVAATLDKSDIEQHAADIPVVHTSGQVRRLHQSLTEIVAMDASTPWWVMLAGTLNVVEPYRTLATDLAAPWRDAMAEAEAGLREQFVTVFVASPGSVVPFHIDYQHNVLAQVAGTKEVTIGGISEADIEECLTSGVRNLRVRPDVTETFLLHPGEGLYIPPCTPHSVVGIDGISISLSSMWVTRWGQTERMARYWNARLRRLGFRPGAPSGGRMLDRAKGSTATLYGFRARRRMRRAGRS
jgi:mannose-6-phosphate isomerase-like protein (cupin superfamily)